MASKFDCSAEPLRNWVKEKERLKELGVFGQYIYYHDPLQGSFSGEEE
jgi:hypothetical protein